MEGISEKNTKAEILAAYSELLAKNTEASKQLEGMKAAGAVVNPDTDLSAEVLRLTEEIGILTSKNTELADKLSEVSDLDPDLSAKIEAAENEKNCLIGVIGDLNQQKVTVVIPFVSEFSQGNELQLALRGWEENFKENFNVVVIGDRAKWMSDELTVIECKRIGDNPPLDIVNKMKMAIDSDLVTEKFIWANDDQYLISPCMLADFETLKCTGLLGEKNYGSSLYQKNKQKTLELLKKEGKGTWDFSSHTPFVFEKQKLQDLISKFNLSKEAHLVATLYLNWYFPGFVPYECDSQVALDHDNLKIGVYRQSADMDRLKKLMPGKKLINNSETGWSDKLSVILNKRFPEKCKFEK